MCQASAAIMALMQVVNSLLTIIACIIACLDLVPYPLQAGLQQLPASLVQHSHTIDTRTWQIRTIAFLGAHLRVRVPC